MADGLDWLLNRAGLDPAMIAHFFHLDDDESVPGCTWCSIDRKPHDSEKAN